MTDVIALEKLAVGYYPSKSDSFKPHRSVLIRGGGGHPDVVGPAKGEIFSLKIREN